MKRKAKFRVGQVVRVTAYLTITDLRNGSESRAAKDDLLELISIDPLVGKCWTGRVSLLLDEIRPLTSLERGAVAGK